MWYDYHLFFLLVESIGFAILIIEKFIYLFFYYWEAKFDYWVIDC